MPARDGPGISINQAMRIAQCGGYAIQAAARRGELRCASIDPLRLVEDDVRVWAERRRQRQQRPAPAPVATAQ
jgi:hypothetical protein